MVAPGNICHRDCIEIAHRRFHDLAKAAVGPDHDGDSGSQRLVLVGRIVAPEARQGPQQGLACGAREAAHAQVAFEANQDASNDPVAGEIGGDLRGVHVEHHAVR